MHRQQHAVQSQKNIFAFAFDNANASALGMAGEMRSGLRLHGDGVKDVKAADSPTLSERAERLNDSFPFREFRHERRTGSRTRFESEAVLPHVLFGSIHERPENGF